MLFYKIIINFLDSFTYNLYYKHYEWLNQYGMDNNNCKLFF